MQDTQASAEELFGGQASEAARSLIRMAKRSSDEQALALLAQARRNHADCLPVYYLLYKLQARLRRLKEAEETARAGLREAARQAELPEDFRLVDVAQLHGRVLVAQSPERFWLFTLKALAFICLRRQRREEASALLALIARLDPGHSTGSDVTQALLAGSEA